MITGHGSHDLTFGIHDEDQPEILLDAKGGLGGDIAGAKLIDLRLVGTQDGRFVLLCEYLPA